MWHPHRRRIINPAVRSLDHVRCLRGSAMTIACGNGVIEAVAFGGIVEDLVGMSAADFDGHAYLEKDEMVDSMEPCGVADEHSEERELSFSPFVQLEMVQRVLRLEKKRHCEDGDDEREE
ncbi:hypothetical protein HDU80_000520, partial [Chytriomyces hyalinus]